MTRADVSICLIVKNDPAIEECLKSIRDWVQEIVIVDTGSNDGITQNIARKYADIFEVFTDCSDPDTGLINDFSMARQRSFDLATKSWVGWCDSDDVIVGLENLQSVIDSYNKELLKTNPVFLLFPYEYSYNELGKCNCRHYRERLVSNKHAMHWQNPCHEVAIPNDNMQLALITREEITWKHRRQYSPKQMESGRNLRILRKYFEKVGESDARQMYYLGLECCNSGLIDEAIKYLSRYIEISGWDDERAMAAIKLTDIYMGLGQFENALKWAFKTVEIKHTWCEGYFALAKIFYWFAMKGGANEYTYWEKVVYFAKHGFTLPPTKTLLFINPQDREYEIHRYYNMALNKMGDVVGALESTKTALQYQSTDDALVQNKKLYEDFLARQKIAENANILKNNGTINQVAMEQVFAIINNQPIPCMIEAVKEAIIEDVKQDKTEVKQLVSVDASKLDIVFYAGDGMEIWNPDTIKKVGQGGSELILMEQAKRLVALGHKVRVYSSCGEDKIYDGVEYCQTHKYKDLTCDVLVISRNAEAIDDKYNIQAKLKLIWVHDIYVWNATNERLLKADRILALSEWHKSNLMNAHNVHSDHIITTRNGVDLNRFDKQVKRNRFKCINSSSPDRSWPVLLSCWPHIKARVPKSELHLFYGFDNWKKVAVGYPGQPEFIASLEAQILSMKSMGVEYHGRVNQETLANEFLSAGVMLFPSWFSETFFIGGAEAQAAGLRIITSSIAAINETVGDRGVRIDGEWTSEQYQRRFIDEAVKALTEEDNSDRLISQQYAKDHFCLDQLAKDWEKMFFELIEKKKTNPVVPYYPTRQYRT